MSNTIPEGWSTQALEGKVHILSGFPFQSALFCDDSARMGIIRIRDLVKQSIETFYAGDFEDVYVVKKGDILIGMDGDFTIVKWSAKDALLNQRVCKVKAESGSGFDTNFLFHSLAEDLLSINAATGATTVKHLSVKDIRGIEKVYPPLPEQQKIATILSSVDDVIEKTRAQIDKLKDLKTGMMQELLTKGIGHTEFKDSPVGLIPESWEVFTMQEVLHAVIDYRGKSPPKSESGVPLITAKNIRQGYIDEEPREYIYEDQYDSWMVRGFPAKGDVFITTEAPLGNVARVPSYKFAIGQRVLTLSPKEFITTDYLFYMMQSRYFREQLDLESTGSTVAGIKQSTFRNILIPIPPKAEQVKIAGPLNAINRRTDTVSLKLDEMVSLKKALMQDLLTGKVRVKLTDLDTETAS